MQSGRLLDVVKMKCRISASRQQTGHDPSRHQHEAVLLRSCRLRLQDVLLVLDRVALDAVDAAARAAVLLLDVEVGAELDGPCAAKRLRPLELHRSGPRPSLGP